MKRIAFINQRYGKDVNGGSEYYTMLMAQKLKEFYEVEVLTSKALTYDKWENYYNLDLENIDGITVRRFGVKTKRRKILQKIAGKLITWFHMNFLWLNRLWLKAQGPYVPGLVEFIKRHKKDYDVFIFVTYLYYPAVFGLPEVGDKAIFVPTAHDESCIYYKIFRKLFICPKAFVYLTEEEKNFVHDTFRNQNIRWEIAGTGVELPDHISVERFRLKYDIEGNYLIYVGRVEKNKGCEEMFNYFFKTLKTYPDLQLVILGKAYMEIPVSDRIHYLGFVPEQDKFDGILGADVLWLPSEFESLSIAVLEAMSLGRPVIVNGGSEVLKGHCEKSGAGISYTSCNEFIKGLQRIKEDYSAMSSRAKRYINSNYLWEGIIDKWVQLIDSMGPDIVKE